jgi:hypothetical protein
MANQRIDVSNATRNHPLFGMLDYVVRRSHSQTTELEAINKRLTKIEDTLKGVIEVQKELKQLMDKCQQSMFSIEKTPYQVLVTSTISKHSM